MTEPDEWTEARILSLLKSHHGDSRMWAFLTKVADGTGFGVSGWCDALAMGLWPSKGLDLYGYEVKVTRSDWQREMQNVKKAETFSSRCHYWFVAAPKGVVKLEELPATWGLIEPAGNGMKVRRAPTRTTPAALDYEFLAAVLRYAVQQSPHELFLKEERAKAKKEGKDEASRNRDVEFRSLEQQRDSLKKRIDEFEKASGVVIGTWNAGDVGEAVKAVLDCRMPHMKQKLENVERWARELADGAKKTLESMKEAPDVVQAPST